MRTPVPSVPAGALRAARRIAEMVGAALRIGLLLVAIALLAGGPARADERASILVVSQSGSAFPRGALYTVDPGNGQRRLLSDFADATQGPLGELPVSVTVDRDGRIFVSDIAGNLFDVDPGTGGRRLVAGPLFGGTSYFTYGLDATRRGALYGVGQWEGVVVTDPTTGVQRLVSHVANPAQWAPAGFQQILELTVDREGTVYVATNDFAAALGSAIHRIDPSTGVATRLSDFADASQGADVGEFWFATGMAIARSGEILVNSGYTGAAPRPLLFRIDPRTGKRRVLSDFDRPDQGPTGATLNGLAIERDGSIVVSTGDPATGASDPPRLMRVNAVTGRRSLLSDGGDPGQGPVLTGVTSLAFREGHKADAR